MIPEDFLNYSLKPSGALWSSLTSTQQDEVLTAYEESEDESNLVQLSVIKAKLKE
jgi:hypothetical protein